jgi:hypothetical protein
MFARQNYKFTEPDYLDRSVNMKTENEKEPRRRIEEFSIQQYCRDRCDMGLLQL